MRFQIITLLAFLVLLVPINPVFSEQFEVFTNNQVFTTEQPLFVYGKGLSNENLIIRLFAPDESIVKFDQITADNDGLFNHTLLIWPESTTDFPYGTYTIEVISTQQSGLSKKIDVKFTSTAELIDIPVERQLNTLVFAPETAAVNSKLRIFVQTTSDGLLVGGDPTKLLETTHVHLPSGKVETLSTSFETLHQGLYFVDYTPKEEGTYVFHVVAFSQGTISHGSAATTVLSQDLSGISEQIIKLNLILEETSIELDILKSQIEGFDDTLEKANENINTSVLSMSSSVDNISEASSQLNSLFLPVVTSIGIIVALQIAILARRR